MASPDLNINNAPDYIKQYIASAASTGPAALLLDGSWCGHGEAAYRIYDIAENGNSVFRLQLPDTASETGFPAAVKATSVVSQESFLIYDAKQHTANYYGLFKKKKKSKFADIHHCSNCNETNFKVSVGFEVPGDAEEPNDTSWFVLATECVHCGDKTIAFDDETA
ncbi:MAG: hypothetical protein J7621_02225 [Niastella sp.]|nr:hypothetical protein [Niastella sp.]